MKKFFIRSQFVIEKYMLLTNYLCRKKLLISDWEQSGVGILDFLLTSLKAVTKTFCSKTADKIDVKKNVYIKESRCKKLSSSKREKQGASLNYSSSFMTDSNF